jgi:hypothetical protein
MGYADPSSSDGLSNLNPKERHSLDRFHLQMYRSVVMNIAGVDSLECKTLLETGCGRGGGLKMLVQKLKPRYAVGTDFSGS